MSKSSNERHAAHYALMINTKSESESPSPRVLAKLFFSTYFRMDQTLFLIIAAVYFLDPEEPAMELLDPDVDRISLCLASDRVLYMGT